MNVENLKPGDTIDLGYPHYEEVLKIVKAVYQTKGETTILTEDGRAYVGHNWTIKTKGEPCL